MSKFVARIVVLTGEASIFAVLLIGAAIARQLESMLPLAIAVPVAMLLGLGVFGLAALLEICDRLKELVELTRKKTPAQKAPVIAKEIPAPVWQEEDREKAAEWVQKLR
jgi:hypothetical protein